SRARRSFPTRRSSDLRALLAAQWIDELVVVVTPGGAGRAEGLFVGWPRVSVRAVGGASRRDSVLAGVESLDAASDDWVLVHDARSEEHTSELQSRENL